MALQADRLEQAAAAFRTSVSGEVRFAAAPHNVGVVDARHGEHWRLRRRSPG